MAEVTAKRVDGIAHVDTAAICYGKENGEWFIYFPEIGAGMLSKHRIEEYDDGTITAYPSIALSSGPRRRHGWLKHGIWESCADEVL